MNYLNWFSKAHGVFGAYGVSHLIINEIRKHFRRGALDFLHRLRVFPFLLPILAGLYAPIASADDPVILALGDSLTAGYGLAAADAFPAKLEAALRDAGRPARIINAGVSGDTSGGGLSRVDWLMAEAPDLVILELGANDGLRALNPEDTKRNLAAIIEKAQTAGAHVLLAGMFAPPNLGAEYGEAFNAVFPDLAKQYDVTFYPFFLEGIVAQPGLNLGDGMHPNEAGVDVIVTNIFPTVLEALDRVGDSQ